MAHASPRSPFDVARHSVAATLRAIADDLDRYQRNDESDTLYVRLKIGDRTTLIGIDPDGTVRMLEHVAESSKLLLASN